MCVAVVFMFVCGCGSVVLRLCLFYAILLVQGDVCGCCVYVCVWVWVCGPQAVPVPRHPAGVEVEGCVWLLCGCE